MRRPHVLSDDARLGGTQRVAEVDEGHHAHLTGRQTDARVTSLDRQLGGGGGGGGWRIMGGGGGGGGRSECDISISAQPLWAVMALG